jgi:hypothetical protein
MRWDNYGCRHPLALHVLLQITRWQQRHSVHRRMRRLSFGDSYSLRCELSCVERRAACMLVVPGQVL